MVVQTCDERVPYNGLGFEMKWEPLDSPPGDCWPARGRASHILQARGGEHIANSEMILFNGTRLAIVTRNLTDKDVGCRNGSRYRIYSSKGTVTQDVGIAFLSHFTEGRL